MTKIKITKLKGTQS